MIPMSQRRGYLKLLIETIPGYKSYETIEGKTATDALVRERCTVCMNRIKINLEECRGHLIAALGTDRSEIEILSSLILLSREISLAIMDQISETNSIASSDKSRDRLYEIDRNVLELASQLEYISEEILSFLMAAADMDYAEREILLQRGLEQFRQLWQEREAIFMHLTY